MNSKNFNIIKVAFLMILWATMFSQFLSQAQINNTKYFYKTESLYTADVSTAKFFQRLDSVIDVAINICHAEFPDSKQVQNDWIWMNCEYEIPLDTIVTIFYGSRCIKLNREISTTDLHFLFDNKTVSRDVKIYLFLTSVPGYDSFLTTKLNRYCPDVGLLKFCREHFKFHKKNVPARYRSNRTMGYEPMFSVIYKSTGEFTNLEVEYNYTKLM